MEPYQSLYGDEQPLSSGKSAFRSKILLHQKPPSAPGYSLPREAKRNIRFQQNTTSSNGGGP